MKRKQIKCKNGIIKELTLQETIDEFKYILNTKDIFKWQGFFEQDDLNQIIYMSLIKAYNYYDLSKGTSFLTTLKQVIHSNIVYEYKKQTSIKRGGKAEHISLYSKSKSCKDEDDIILNVIPSNISTENIVIRNTVNTILNNIINTLSDESKSLIQLRFIDNLSLREIAKIKNISYQTVSNRINKSLRTMRIKLKQYGYVKSLCV